MRLQRRRLKCIKRKTRNLMQMYYRKYLLSFLLPTLRGLSTLNPTNASFQPLTLPSNPTSPFPHFPLTFPPQLSILPFTLKPSSLFPSTLPLNPLHFLPFSTLTLAPFPLLKHYPPPFTFFLLLTFTLIQCTSYILIVTTGFKCAMYPFRYMYMIIGFAKEEM